VVRAAYLLRSVWAVLAALLVGSILIRLGGSDPLRSYAALFRGAFLEYHGVANTLVRMSPLILAALAVALPLRAGLFNIGGEGQIYVGALAATVTALHLPAMPGATHILVCSLAGAAGGGLWAVVAALLKAYRGINEIIVTLLMNYVAINFVSYVVSGPMMEEGAPYPYSPEIPDTLFLPHVLPETDAHLGVVIGGLLAVVLWAIFRGTHLGFSLAVVGTNVHAARYAGMSVRRHILLSLLVAGALAGLAGTYEVLGLKYRLFHMFSPGYGYDGIVVTFLAGGNPLAVIVAATFLAGLRSGAGMMQRAVGVETTVVEALEGLVIIFVAVSLAFRFDDTPWARAWRQRRATESDMAGAGEGTGAA
jgi:general nucleoside transport system permease protein